MRTLSWLDPARGGSFVREELCFGIGLAFQSISACPFVERLWEQGVRNSAHCFVVQIFRNLRADALRRLANLQRDGFEATVTIRSHALHPATLEQLGERSRALVSLDFCPEVQYSVSIAVIPATRAIDCAGVVDGRHLLFLVATRVRIVALGEIRADFVVVGVVTFRQVSATVFGAWSRLKLV